MKLEDLLPSSPEFKASGKTYRIRPPTVADRVHFTTTYGEEGLTEIFRKQEIKPLFRLIYWLLDEKKDFLASKATIIDDDGFEKEVVITGPEKLMAAMASSAESDAAIAAFYKALALSDPKIETAMEAKLAIDEQKKSQQTGQSSTTS